MKSHESGFLSARLVCLLLIAICAVAVSTAVLGQDISELRVVDLQRTGNPPTGPYNVVVEQDPGLPTHTIYRPASIPVFYGVYPSVGHGGTYNQDNGGPFGEVAVAWLRWQLMGDTSASGRGYFVGDDCTICRDSNWEIDSRSLP